MVLFVLRFNVPVNKFQSFRDGHRFLGINQCCGESTGCRHGGNRTQDLLNRSPSVLTVITGTVILHLNGFTACLPTERPVPHSKLVGFYIYSLVCQL